MAAGEHGKLLTYCQVFTRCLLLNRICCPQRSRRSHPAQLCFDLRRSVPGAALTPVHIGTLEGMRRQERGRLSHLVLSVTDGPVCHCGLVLQFGLVLLVVLGSLTQPSCGQRH